VQLLYGSPIIEAGMALGFIVHRCWPQVLIPGRGVYPNNSIFLGIIQKDEIDNGVNDYNISLFLSFKDFWSCA